MEPTTFERPEDFRTWLEQHHDSEQELWVGYFKKGSGKPSTTWPESADKAIRPLRDLRPSVDMVEPRRYLDVQTSGDEDMAWGKRFYMKGGFLSELSDAYVDAGLASVADAPGAECGIYGDEKYDRLVGLKRTYDPDNVFRLNQNIRP